MSISTNRSLPQLLSCCTCICGEYFPFGPPPRYTSAQPRNKQQPTPPAVDQNRVQSPRDRVATSSVNKLGSAFVSMNRSQSRKPRRYLISIAGCPLTNALKYGVRGINAGKTGAPCIMLRIVVWLHVSVDSQVCSVVDKVWREGLDALCVWYKMF